MPVVSISIPTNLLKQVDRLVKQGGYFSKSEVFRDAVRELLFQTEVEQRRKTVKSVGVLIVFGDHKDAHAVQQVNRIRHDFDDVVDESTHRHIGGHLFIEYITMAGPLNRIIQLTRRMRGIRGISQVKLALVPLEQTVT